ncbi:MAG: preprotein translocase subunit SecG [Spirochaetes bacterium GWF1_51_8]|nr:MAG: preprotein translocase subunit SecG [Spirochaetes bacterium GWF1_51_8]
MYTFLLILFIIVVILIIPVILMQSGSGAETGMFGSNITLGAFGAKSSEVLLKVTRWLVAIFLALAFLLSYIKVIEHKSLAAKPVQEVTEGQPADQSAPAQDQTPADPSGGQSSPLLPTQ